MGIEFFNRRLGRMETEEVYGDQFVRLLYGNPVGFAFTNGFLVRKFVSRLYGGLQSTSRSGQKVPGFVSKFKIPMELYEPGPFRSFNDFFIRRFRPGLRPFPKEAGEMGAFAEARYLAFANSLDPISLPVKACSSIRSPCLAKPPEKNVSKAGPASWRGSAQWIITAFTFLIPAGSPTSTPKRAAFIR
jgi:hypothetical protein